MRSVLVACFLAVLITPSAYSQETGTQVPPPPPVQDLAKRLAVLEGRLGELDKAVKTIAGELEKASKASEAAGLLKSVDGRLQVIQGKLPDLERWSTWSIGDSKTLSKVAETIFELVARRTNEAVASQALYAPSVPERLKWVLSTVGD